MTTDEIRKLLDEATPGPWGISGSQTVRSVRFGKLFAWIAKANWSNGPANARLIAAAPDLAAEVLRLRSLIGRYINHVGEMEGTCSLPGPFGFSDRLTDDEIAELSAMRTEEAP